MDIFCSKCGTFFKSWSHGERECCGMLMKELKPAPLGGVVVKKANHYISPDITPYRAVAVDKETGIAPMIESRKQHKEFLRRNNYIEIGNETPKARRVEGDHNVRQELAQATHEVLRKHR